VSSERNKHESDLKKQGSGGDSAMEDSMEGESKREVPRKSIRGRQRKEGATRSKIGGRKMANRGAK
jgi:hypothetical protein